MPVNDESMQVHKKTAELAKKYGLVVRGGFNCDLEDRGLLTKDGNAAMSLVLLGNAGSSFWEVFSQSPQYRDGKADPLDRWSQKTGEEMADALGGKAYFPFGGPPYQPFLSWAKRSENLQSSKLGMLIHPTYGLWHAYRFAIALDESLDKSSNGLLGESLDGQSADALRTDICLNCEEQPCLKTCPTEAFSESGYDVASCYDHLSKTPGNECVAKGCAARRSCPQGAEFLYDADHGKFHMTQFFLSLKERFAE